MRIFSSSTILLLQLLALVTLSSINNNNSIIIISVIVGVGVGVVDALSIQPSALSEYQFKLSSRYPLLTRGYSVFSVDYDGIDGNGNVGQSFSGSRRISGSGSGSRISGSSRRKRCVALSSSYTVAEKTIDDHDVIDSDEEEIVVDLSERNVDSGNNNDVAVTTLTQPEQDNGKIIMEKEMEESTATTTTKQQQQRQQQQRQQQFWKWRNHDVFTEVRSPVTSNISSSSSTTTSDQNDNTTSDSNNKPKVILLHGFGASTTYWRETMSTLQHNGFEVHALDLLGQGRSSKPFLSKSTASTSASSNKFGGKFPYRLYPKTTDDDGKRQATAMQHQETTSSLSSSSSPVTMGKNTNTTIQYSINLWAKMVDDYARTNNMDEVILMGNSLGSLVALSAATGDFIHSPNNIDRENLFGYLAGNNVGDRSRVKGICLFNCAVGLNSMNILKNTSYSEVQRTIFKVIFQLLNKLIFDNEWLLQYALRNVVTKELLRDALRGLYMCNPDRVDDELVDSFYYPAKLGNGDGENEDEYGGVIEAIRQIYTNDAGLSPMELHKKYPEILNSIPLHLIWGNDDVVTPIEGDVGKFYCDRVANNRGGKGMTTIDVVKGGHILFDDNPVETHEAMMRWIQKKVL